MARNGTTCAFFSASNVQPSPVPRAAGVYALYFTGLEEIVPSLCCISCDGFRLLYTGSGFNNTVPRLSPLVGRSDGCKRVAEFLPKNLRRQRIVNTDSTSAPQHLIFVAVITAVC